MSTLNANAIDDDEAYNSASDEDFNPDNAPPEIESSSDDEEAAPARGGRVRKQIRKRSRDDDVPAELDPEDLITIQERQSKKQRKDDSEADFSDDEGGEGGFVKTRAQRRNEYVMAQCTELYWLTRVITDRKNGDHLRERTAQLSTSKLFGAICPASPSAALRNQKSPKTLTTT
jgi:hypothetical protein